MNDGSRGERGGGGAGGDSVGVFSRREERRVSEGVKFKDAWLGLYRQYRNELRDKGMGGV